MFLSLHLSLPWQIWLFFFWVEEEELLFWVWSKWMLCADWRVLLLAGPLFRILYVFLFFFCHLGFLCCCLFQIIQHFEFQVCVCVCVWEREREINQVRERYITEIERLTMCVWEREINEVRERDNRNRERERLTKWERERDYRYIEKERETKQREITEM